MGTWKDQLGLCGLFSNQANVTPKALSLEIAGEEMS